MSADEHSRYPLPESALEESAEELYEMSPCGYLSTDIEGHIVKANKTLAAWLGYAAGELISGKRFIDLLTVGGRIFYETHFRLLLRMQNSVDEIALDLICKDGRVIPTLINARQKRDENGTPIVNRFTVFNFTERRMYERDVLIARNFFQTTLSSIGDAVVSTDAAGSITFMNPVAERLSGWNSEDAIGKPIEEVLELLRENSSDRVENPIRKVLREGAIAGLSNHTVLIAKDGSAVQIDDSASPIRDGSGTINGAVLIFRDISSQRKAERELAETHETLEKAAVELRNSNENLSQFAHVASHDLRSPLNTIAQFSELLDRDYGDKLGDGKEILTYIINSVTRMQRLIDDLLSYATVSLSDRQDSGPTDASLILESAIENLRGEIDASAAVITHGTLPTLHINGTSLVQLFQNLIGNAVRYRGDDAPRIHISAEADDNMWRFSCKDNGMGIAPEHQAQIFEAFKRLHGPERPGAGIGLAVCKKIVEYYNGTIWVESSLNEGSTFFFTLPKG